MIDTTSITAVLLWIIAGPGAAYLVGQLMAFILENVPAWHTFPTWVKFSVPIVLAALFAVVAKVLIGFPDVLAQISPWFTVIVTAISCYVASQRQYMKTRETGYGANPEYK